jgi:exosortase N
MTGIFIPGYFNWDANAVMGVIAIPYVCSVQKNCFSFRYLLPATLAMIAALLLPVNTLFFLALLFSILLFTENIYGKVHPVLFFILILISPVFKNITRMGEFPVRLWLTSQVAGLLHLAGQPAVAAGNLIIINKAEYAVDPACAGLNMLAASLLVCLVLVTFYQRTTCRRLSFGGLTAMLLMTVLLNVIANFFRILLLVSFKVMPGNFYHDLIGIGCLIIYLMAPLLFLLKPFIVLSGKQVQSPPFTKPSLKKPLGLNYLLLGMLMCIAPRISKADHLLPGDRLNINITGYKQQILEGGIIKLAGNDALIYIKPSAFYAPEHDPMICWTGSGYIFNQIKTERFGGYTVYTALLTKQKDKIYAAWWFDNGPIKTVNQLYWRWLAVRGRKPFYLVNVNSSDPEKLQTLTLSLLNHPHLLNP